MWWWDVEKHQTKISWNKKWSGLLRHIWQFTRMDCCLRVFWQDPDPLVSVRVRRAGTGHTVFPALLFYTTIFTNCYLEMVYSFRWHKFFRKTSLPHFLSGIWFILSKSDSLDSNQCHSIVTPFMFIYIPARD